MTKSQTDKHHHPSSKNMPSQEDIAEYIKHNSNAIMHSFQTATTGINQIYQAMAQYTQSLVQMSIAAAQAAASARTLQDVVKVHNDYAKTSMDALVENGTRISEMTLKIANDTAQPLHQHVNETMQKFKQRTAA